MVDRYRLVESRGGSGGRSTRRDARKRLELQHMVNLDIFTAEELMTEPQISTLTRGRRGTKERE